MTEHPPRDDTETTTHRRCPICGVTFTPVGRQAYHSNACRQVAYRRRAGSVELAPVVPTGGRREHSIYRCAECETRYLGQQWCPECNRPCRRLAAGGACRDCGELLTVEELLGGVPMA